MLKRDFLKRAVAIIFILLVLCFSAGLFLDHSHECSGEHCAICFLIKGAKETFAGVSSGALTLYFILLAHKIISNQNGFIFLKSGTLVLQKVKLSN